MCRIIVALCPRVGDSLRNTRSVPDSRVMMLGLLEEGIDIPPDGPNTSSTNKPRAPSDMTCSWFHECAVTVD